MSAITLKMSVPIVKLALIIARSLLNRESGNSSGTPAWLSPTFNSSPFQKLQPNSTRDHDRHHRRHRPYHVRHQPPYRNEHAGPLVLLFLDPDRFADMDPCQ